MSNLRLSQNNFHDLQDLAAAITSSALQNASCIRVDQHGKSIANALRIKFHEDCTFPFDASSENASQAQQRAAAANFTTFASAVADDLAIGAQDRIQ